MALSSDQENLVVNWLKDHNVNPQCLACEGDCIEIGDIIEVTVRAAQPGTQAAAGPMVQLICNKCYHISLFAAQPMGLAT